MAINPLNSHYSMTNPASVYDEEALTALELAGRTAAKVNECVEAFNELETNTIDRLENQEDVIIPDAVDKEVRRYVDEGEFEDVIDEHLGNLETRVDNLTSAVKPGSTTADAELYDIRTGREEGESYINAGEAVRAKANLTDINRFFDNDIFKAQSTNLYTFDDDVFNYKGVAPHQKLIGDKAIAPGKYSLIVTDTNAERIIISYRKASDPTSTLYRVADINNPKATSYNFVIPEINETLILSIYYGASTQTQGTPKDYYFKRAYIFTQGSVKIPSEFVHKGSSITDTVEVITQKGENLYTGGENGEYDYDGVSLERQITYEQPLSPGKYIIRINNPLPRVIITTSNDERLLDVTDMASDEFYKFVVPEGVNGIKIIGYMASSSSVLLPAGKYSFTGITILLDNGKPFLPEYLTHYNEIMSRIDKLPGANTENFLSAVGNISANGILNINDVTHVKKNYSITFNASCGSFTGLRIGQGKTSYNGFYAEITPSAITTYIYYTSASQVTTKEHGLNISDFINVNINVGEGKSIITITTSSGSFTWSDAKWEGCNGNVFAESMGGTFNECALKWTSSDLDKPVWMFGDSYFGMNGARLIGQLFNRGYHNYLISGFPGGAPSSGIVSLKTLLKLKTPSVIIWCLGMNSKDSNGINTNWMNSMDTLTQICSERGITLILSTIPNVPTVDNTYKNAWVRDSGYRYIDFSKAVNTTGSNWYSGMLSSDNIHPTEFGASVLAGRMVNDAPEIMG